MSAYSDAQEALHAAIKTHVEVTEKSTLATMAKAKTLADLALAFRYASGGPQPGGIVNVEK